METVTCNFLSTLKDYHISHLKMKRENASFHLGFGVSAGHMCLRYPYKQFNSEHEMVSLKRSLSLGS